MLSAFAGAISATSAATVISSFLILLSSSTLYVVIDEGLNFSRRVVSHGHPPVAPRALAANYAGAKWRAMRSRHQQGAELLPYQLA